jgi:lysophospholipase L1-like esterase
MTASAARFGAPLIALTVVLSGAASAQELRTSYKLSFGSAGAPGGFQQVAPTATYNKDVGYGFEPGAKIDVDDRGVTSESPFYFSVAVPEGNYKLTVTLGDPKADSTTTVKAELRRLMLEQIHTPAGQFATKEFIVNVRTPPISTGGSVRLKGDRESKEEAWAWDERITLEFNGQHPSVDSIQIEKVVVPTVYLLGDSTVCDQSHEPYASWGQMLPRFFKPDIAVANHAESGETLNSSGSAHRLEKVLSLVRKGDYVMIQYGHNDMKSKAPDAVAQYKTLLTKWVRDIKSRGGTPILITSVNRHTFEEGQVVNSLKDYPQAVRDVASDTQEDVPLIDLNAMTKTLYEALGEKPSIQLFEHRGTDLSKFDATHHSPYGAYEIAKCVIQGVRDAKLELANHIADDMPAFDPAKPDPVESFDAPPSPGVTNQKPFGD